MEIHAAKLKAMSLCAKVPPYLPDFDIIPFALVYQPIFVATW